MKIIIRHHLGEYYVNIKRGVLQDIDEYLFRYRKSKIVVFVDENVYRLHYDAFKSKLKEFTLIKIIVPSGEKSKQYNNVLSYYQTLIENEVTRKDLIIAFGGGVVGDLAGFIAATYLRGIDYIQIPTTLLSQIDSSIGGKVAVDLPEGKNLVGSFYHPKEVFIDVCMLETLPEIEVKNGLAEIIKTAFIKDMDLLRCLEDCSGIQAFKRNIERYIVECCLIKKEVIEEDELDKANRIILNYGHTIGHALEAASNYQVSHGVAVAYGMLEIERLAYQHGIGNKELICKLEELYEKFEIPVTWDIPKEQLKEYIFKDKKKEKDIVNIVLVEEIGKAYVYKAKKEFFQWE